MAILNQLFDSQNYPDDSQDYIGKVSRLKAHLKERRFSKTIK